MWSRARLAVQKGTRYRKAAAAGVASAASKVVSAASQLVLVPMMLGYLGDREYGIWLTLQSTLAFSAFADFGLGNGAMNAMTAAHATRDEARANGVISTALALLSAIGMAMVAIMAAVCLATDQAPSFIGHTPATTLRLAIVVYVLYVSINLPLGFAERICISLQDGWIGHVARGLAAVATPFIVWLVIRAHGSFPAVCAAVLLPTLVGWIGTWLYLKHAYPWLAARRAAIDFAIGKDLLRTGFWFLLLQVCAVLVWSTDSLIIAWKVGPESVTAYGIPQRLFSIVLLMSSMIVLPLWPAYADALSHKDYRWMRRTLRLSLAVVAVLSIVGSLMLLAVIPVVVPLWIGHSLPLPAGLCSGFAALAVCQSCAAAMSMYLNGTSRIAFQVALSIAQLVLTLGLKLLLIGPCGLAAMPWVTVVVFIVLGVAPTIWVLAGIEKDAEQAQDHLRDGGAAGAVQAG